MTDNTLKARLERCKALQDQPGPHDGWVDDKTYVQYDDPPEQVVEVREGYGITSVKVVPHGHSENVPLSEALTLRTAEDVRREALEEIDRLKKAGQELVKTLCEPVDAHATLPWLDQRAKAIDAWSDAMKGECDD